MLKNSLSYDYKVVFYIYFRARYFDTDQGRFINRDPLGYVDGMGLYNGYFIPRGLDPFGFEENDASKVKENEVSKKNEDSISSTVAILKKEENFRSYAYPDSKKHLTIGYGFKISDNEEILKKYKYDVDKLKDGTQEIRQDDSDKIIEELVKRKRGEAEKGINQNYPGCWDRVDPVMHDILTQMVYQMGPDGLGSFKKMIKALCGSENPDYDEAADEMLKSRWHRKQTPARAKRCSNIVRGIKKK